ncbi:MAG: RluA family pseudouridine synthase [Thermoanaerobaculia bacterium]|nr:RluA family pseudouridine synthase [Thermoanaerobaculia bacterium]
MASSFGVSSDLGEAMRVDLALTQPPFSLSRREAKRVLDAGRVLLDSRPVGVASRLAQSGAHLTLLEPEAAVALLHLDARLLVADKPPAIPTQPSPGSSNPSLLEVVASMLKRRGEASDLFLVHRLDTNTTGVIAFARTRQFSERLSKLISGGMSEKVYRAIVVGRIDAPMSIDAPIGRLAGNVFHVHDSGKPSHSEVTVVASSDRASLIEVRIATGRTHQIRVHLAHVGHPVLGDRKYGSALQPTTPPARPMLHALRLGLPGLGVFSAPSPADFEAVANELGLATVTAT